ncbi:MAG TPA: carboxypeptidase regulatory-like domain-containing protein [Candidatus Saccharimonadales bacterium]|nr:carboxypeptidase regulatory-like domain-containing protein [Candidatus Saccharimonadales bacterium]
MKSNRMVVASLFLATVCMSVSSDAQRRSDPQRDMHPSSQPGDPSLAEGASLANISGTVRTMDGRVVQDARIELRDTARGNQTVTAHSDAGGSFALYNILPGDYEITASSGISESRERVRIDSMAHASTVELRLPNKSPAEVRVNGGSTVSVSQYKIPGKARSLYVKAAQALAHGKLDQATEKVNEALAVCPKFAEALTLKGVLESDNGKHVEAIANFQQAIQYDSNYPLSYIALASEFNSAGRFDESLIILGQVERLTTAVWQTYFELARANIGKRQYATALQDTERASKLQGGAKKETPELHLIRGYALVGLTDVRRATQEIEMYLARQPTGQASDSARKMLDHLREETITASK